MQRTRQRWSSSGADEVAAIGLLLYLARLCWRPKHLSSGRWAAEVMPHHFVFTLWTITAIMLGALPAAASTSAIAGTRVSLSVPKNFEVASDFAGIIWRDAGASVHVVEIPTSATEMRASFTKRALASRGMALSRVEDVESAIGAGTLFHVSQVAHGVEFQKWLLVAGSSSETVLLTATVPTTLATELEHTLRESLLTATWEPQRAVDPRDGVGFFVSETKDLKIARSVMGSALLLTEGGSQSTESVEAPFIVIARSTAEVAISDLSTFAKRRLAETNEISNQTVTYESELIVGGMPAHELLASATAENSPLVVVYQVVAFDGHHYYLIQGRVGAGLQDRYLEQFRTVARSLSSQQ